MKKLFKTIVTVVSLCACLGSFAFGGATKASADLYWTTMEPLIDRTPECALILEEAKVKNMTDFGYYNVDGVDVWHFVGENKGGNGVNPEIRFVTEGTQTRTKPYTLEPTTVDSFSFWYRIDNDTNYRYVDDTESQYIVQILCSDGSYPVIKVTVIEDGGWHMISIDENTPVSQSNVGDNMYSQVKNKFCGFLFKMAGLDGEFMIMDIELCNRGAILPPLNPYDEPELPEESGDVETSEESTEIESPVTSEELESSKDSSSVSEWEEPASDNLSTDDEEVASDTAQPGEEEDSGILAQLGCASTLGGGTVLLTLASAGFVMAIRKREE